MIAIFSQLKLLEREIVNVIMVVLERARRLSFGGHKNTLMP